MLPRFVILLSLSSVVSVIASPAMAEDTLFTVTMRANYEFNILGGTPLNPGMDTGYLPFAALGDITFELDPSLNDPNVTTVPFTNFMGELPGTPPSPANFLPHFISPNVMFFGGELTNIVRDGNGEVISADVDNLQARWRVVGLPGSDIDGVELVTGGNAFDPNSDLPFFGSVNAIPFAVGDVIKGPDVVDPTLGDEAFEVFLDGFPAPVVLGRLRTLTVVPEPASMTLLLTLLLCGGGRWRSPVTRLE